MRSWETKCWGKTSCIINTRFYSKHELEVQKGGVCSFHMHRLRQNRFVVSSGIIKVVWAFGKDVDGVTLERGDSWDVQALVPHQFQVIESGIVTEEYFSDRGGEISNGDICRLSVGCKLSQLQAEILGKSKEYYVIDSDGEFYF